MNVPDLAGIGSGFSDLSRGSQAVFRAALHAMSHPGRLIELVHDAQVPAGGHRASAGILLALMDAGSRLWLSPSLAESGPWLRFHTGCILVAEPAAAHLAWVAGPGEMPPLASLAQGSDDYPDQSTTCILDVPALDDGGQWILRGPGIPDETRLRIGGLPVPLGERFAARFATEWKVNHAQFPRGVDVFLATPRLIAGLPRTTRLELES